MGKGKKTAIIVIVVVLILALIAGGVWAVNEYVINNPKDLFDKYTAQNLSEVFNFDTSLISQIRSDNSGKTRETVTNVDFSGMGQNIIAETNLKVNKQNNRNQIDLELKRDDESLFKIQGLNNGDKYAFKSDEIANGYIGIENNKLNELAEKLNLGIANVPSKIEITKGDFEDNKKRIISKLSDEYLPIILNKYTKDKYVKEKNVTIKRDDVEYANATKVTLNTNTKEISELLVELLNKAKEDDDLLGKLMTYSIDGQQKEIKNEIKKQIDSMIESIKKINDNEEIKINTYIYKDKVIKTDIVLEKDGTISIYQDGETKKRVMNSNSSSIENVAQNISENVIADTAIVESKENIIEIDIINNVTDSTQDISFKLLINNNEIMSVDIGAEKKANGSDFDVAISRDNKSLVKLTQTTEYKDSVDVDEIKDDNSMIINNYSAEEIQSLLGQLAPLMTEIVGETADEISSDDISNDNNNESDDNTENENSDEEMQ